MRLLLVTLICLPAVVAADELETIDGAKFTATIESINETGDVAGPGIEAGTKLDSLRTILRNAKTVSVKAKCVLETHGDGRLLANQVLLTSDKFAISLAGGKEMA